MQNGDVVKCGNFLRRVNEVSTRSDGSQVVLLSNGHWVASKFVSGPLAKEVRLIGTDLVLCVRHAAKWWRTDNLESAEDSLEVLPISRYSELVQHKKYLLVGPNKDEKYIGTFTGTEQIFGSEYLNFDIANKCWSFPLAYLTGCHIVEIVPKAEPQTVTKTHVEPVVKVLQGGYEHTWKITEINITNGPNGGIITKAGFEPVNDKPNPEYVKIQKEVNSEIASNLGIPNGCIRKPTMEEIMRVKADLDELEFHSKVLSEQIAKGFVSDQGKFGSSVAHASANAIDMQNALHDATKAAEKASKVFVGRVISTAKQWAKVMKTGVVESVPAWVAPPYAAEYGSKVKFERLDSLFFGSICQEFVLPQDPGQVYSCTPMYNGFRLRKVGKWNHKGKPLITEVPKDQLAARVKLVRAKDVGELRKVLADDLPVYTKTVAGAFDKIKINQLAYENADNMLEVFCDGKIYSQTLEFMLSQVYYPRVV